MSKQEREFLDHLRATSVEAAAEIMAGLQRIKSMYEEMTGDGVGGAPAAPKPADFFYQLARAELDHAAKLMRLGNNQAEMLFEHARRLARRSRGEVAVPVLELKRVEGSSSYEGDFEIRNPFEHEADPRYEIDALCNDTGGTVDHAPLHVKSASGGPVPAHSAATIRVTVDHGNHHGVAFGAVRVMLSADIEKQVAHRRVKVRFS